MEKLPKEVFGEWRHAYEEDKNGIAVYRSIDYSFAPSRGREGFEIKQDGTFSKIATGQEDASETITGEWTQKGDKLIKISFEDNEHSPQKIEITESKEGILKVRKF